MKKFSPIKKTRAYETVIEQLHYSIEKGWYKPGDKLPSERELSEQLSISRNVVREALSILQTSRIIEVRPGIGAFLVDSDIDVILEQIMEVITDENSEVQLIDLLELRQGIEAIAIYAATEKADENDLQEINNALSALEKEVSKGNLGAEEDLNFHMTIGKVSKNKMVIDILNLISEQILEALEETRNKLIEEKKVEQFIGDHRRIYEAIVSGDAIEARNLMWSKLQRTIDFHRELSEGKHV